MPKKIFKAVLLVGLVLLMVSCNNRECNNSNPLLDRYQPNTSRYHKELAKQLQLIDNSKLIYRFQRYENNNGKEYLYVTLQGDSLCAESAIRVLNWDATLLPIKATKGKGYSGAVLENLKIESIQEGSTTEFVYKSVAAIVD